MNEQTGGSVGGGSSTARERLIDPLSALADFVEEADRVLAISVTGISAVRGIPEHVRASDKPEFKDRLAEAEEIGRIAAREIASDFPLLRAHTVVAIWSALEASIPKFAAAWLKERPDALSRPAFERIKVPVTLYEQLSVEGRMSFIVDAVLQDQRAGQPGVARFEGLLDAIGLGGTLEDDLRRDLFEMSQVRNLIVHQFSIVDSRFVAACPWLGVNPGDRFNINRRDYLRYRDAIFRYGTEIAERLVEATGRKRVDVAATSASDRKVGNRSTKGKRQQTKERKA